MSKPSSTHPVPKIDANGMPIPEAAFDWERAVWLSIGLLLFGALALPFYVAYFLNILRRFS